jgi:hypothetical protein
MGGSLPPEGPAVEARGFRLKLLLWVGEGSPDPAWMYRRVGRSCIPR